MVAINTIASLRHNEEISLVAMGGHPVVNRRGEAYTKELNTYYSAKKLIEGGRREKSMCSISHDYQLAIYTTYI